MATLNGKEITQEQLDNLLADINNFKSLADGYEKKNEALEGKVKDLDKLSDLQKELETKENKLYEVTLNSRLSKISKFINSKGRDEKLIAKIGDMSEDDFEFFMDGRTDDVFQNKEEIGSR